MRLFDRLRFRLWHASTMAADVAILDLDTPGFNGEARGLAVRSPLCLTSSQRRFRERGSAREPSRPSPWMLRCGLQKI